MKRGIYGVVDLLSMHVETIFMAPTDSVACRGFSDAVRVTTQLKDHPDDFALWRFGEFSESDNRPVISDQKSQQLLSARDVLRSDEKPSPVVVM